MRTASWQRDYNTSDSRLFANISCSCTSHCTSPAETSTPIALLPQGPTNTSTDLLTCHSHTGPLSSSKPIPDAFTPKSSPTTLYSETKSSPPPENQNRASSSSDSVFEIAVTSAEVTQLQRLPQAKPVMFTGNKH